MPIVPSQIQPQPVQTVEVVGPAGRIKINDTDLADYKSKGYVLSTDKKALAIQAEEAARAADAAAKAAEAARAAAEAASAEAEGETVSDE
jgi:hypothetical protein